MTLVIEATRFKVGEQYHDVVSDYINSVKEVWLPDHAIAISKGCPGIAYKKDNPLIKVQLFDIDDTDIEDYKNFISNRHITWNIIKEVYDNKGLPINNVLAPILKPLNPYTVTPIYHLIDNIREWTEKQNSAYLLDIERKAKSTIYEIPSAMEI